jgi:rhamnosyltransferase
VNPQLSEWLKVMISIIIPTYNASQYLSNLLESIKLQNIPKYEIIIIDSGSTDDTINIAESFGVRILCIRKSEFDHGGTRKKAGLLSYGDILVFLSQDVILKDKNSIKKLIEPLYNDKRIAACYGRQLPKKNASPFATHLRNYNYTNKSYFRTIEDKNKFGFKTIFFSDSFSTYKKQILEEIGWFNLNLIFGEDSHVCAKILKSGYIIGYVAEANVFHSHNYSIFQEFMRYFDIGVFHKTEYQLLEEFGHIGNEGKKYLLSEIKYILLKGELYLLFELFLRNILKYIGYKMGLNYEKLSIKFCKKISMNQNWWVVKQGQLCQ